MGKELFMSNSLREIWHNEIHPRTPVEVAAQVWCHENCASIEMDIEHIIRLAGVFAAEIDREQQKATRWLETAHQHHRNEEYYRGLVVQIGEMLGDAAFIADDGVKHLDVLCAKVPDLVRARLAGYD